MTFSICFFAVWNWSKLDFVNSKEGLEGGFQRIVAAKWQINYFLLRFVRFLSRFVQIKRRKTVLKPAFCNFVLHIVDLLYL